MTDKEIIYELQDILGELHGTVEVTDRLREACREAIKAIDNKSEEKWVYVDDHLPKELQAKVFIAVEDKNGLMQIPRAAIYNGFDKTFEGVEAGEKVIAWTDLPKLPKYRSKKDIIK